MRRNAEASTSDEFMPKKSAGKPPARVPVAPGAPPKTVHSSEELRQLQRAMLDAVRTPLTSDMRMSRRGPAGGSAAALAGKFIKPNDRMNSFERLEIYNRQYWFRLFDCLYDDFPGLRAVLGETRFMAMAEAYITEYPSRTFSLRDLGGRLPRFLQEHPEWAGKRQAVALDVARLEWAQITAFDSAARPPLTVDDLLGADAARLKLRLQPYISLLALAYPVDDFVNTLQPRQTLQTEAAEEPRRRTSRGPARLPKPRPEFLAVHRFENQVYFKSLEQPAFELLRNLDAGLTIDASCRKVISVQAQRLDWGSVLQAWFANWTQLGWFCR